VSPIFLGVRPGANEYATGETFFSEIGLLDGMTPYISDIFEWTTPDGNFGEVCTINQSVAQFASTAAGISYIGFNLDATYSRVLISVYGRGSGFIQAAAQTSAINAAADLATSYVFSSDSGGLNSELIQRTFAVDVSLQSNTNIFQPSGSDQGSWGFAAYFKGASPPAVGEQHCYTRNTTEQWWPVVDDTDAIDSHAGFRSVVLRTETGGARFTLPFSVWVGN
jgi:hypothetical protein